MQYELMAYTHSMILIHSGASCALLVHMYLAQARATLNTPTEAVAATLLTHITAAHHSSDYPSMLTLLLAPSFPNTQLHTHTEPDVR